MKKAAFVALIGLLFMLSGCNAWLNGSYASVTPHKEQYFQPEQVLLAPKTYADIENILVNMVLSGQQKKTISMEAMKGDWQKYVTEAVQYIQYTYPIGAYAIQDVSYDIGSSGGKIVLAMDITYDRSVAEIGAIQRVENPEEIVESIYNALRNFDVSVSFYMEDYKEVDFIQIVRDNAILYPQYIIEEPRVSVMTYPREGKDRVVELTFGYATSRSSLREMQQQVGRFFSASELYVSEEGTDMEKLAQLYAFLMNRSEYTVQTSITPAYSLLRYGVGDSKAFATVYAAMCRQAGIDCETISGSRMQRTWYWNLIRVDGRVYHIDLLRCLEEGRFSYKTAQEMTDSVWDYSAY